MSDIDILGTLAPNTGSTAPLTRSKYIAKGYAIVADATERDSIPAPIKSGGFIVFRVDTQAEEYWNGSSWVAKPGGGGGTGGGMGFPYTYSTTTTDADPTAGTFRLNNATIASATKLYIDLLEYGGTDVTAWIDSLDDYAGAGLLGVIRLQSKSDATKWIEYTVTAWTTATGYRKLDIAFKDGPGGLLTTAGDTYISFDYVGGPLGYLPVANASARTSLPASKRLAGMLVRENDTGALYVLANDLTTWALADTSVVNQTISHASADAVPAEVVLRKSRGTEAAPTAHNALDGLGRIRVQGHNGTNFVDVFKYEVVAEQAGGTGLRVRTDYYQHDGDTLRLKHSTYVGHFTSSADGNNIRWSLPVAAGQSIKVYIDVVGKGPSNNQVFRSLMLRARRKGSADLDPRLENDVEPLDNLDNSAWNIGYTLNTTTNEVEVWDNGNTAENLTWDWEMLVRYV